jgi:hypothetical protein
MLHFNSRQRGYWGRLRSISREFLGLGALLMLWFLYESSEREIVRSRNTIVCLIFTLEYVEKRKGMTCELRR